MKAQKPLKKLTKREQHFLSLVAAGYPKDQILDKMSIDNHMFYGMGKRILKKAIIQNLTKTFILLPPNIEDRLSGFSKATNNQSTQSTALNI